nr:LIM domain-containing protein PLIM2c-like [Tanacetum cinerariifolium]
MGFGGTIDKCNACDKTVHFNDLMTFDNVIYHKNCFKCTHCKGTLVMSNYSSMDGVLYCMPHFEQLYKETGNFSKNFRTSKPRENSTTQRPNKFSYFFSGTQDKCQACDKTVYLVEKMTMEALDGVLYCRHHFAQLFLEKGTLSHVLEAANRKNTIVKEVDKLPEQETVDESEPETTEEATTQEAEQSEEEQEADQSEEQEAEKNAI